MSRVSESQNANLNRHIGKITAGLSAKKAIRNLSSDQVGKVARWQEQVSLSKTNEANVTERGIVGYADRAMNGLAELVSLAQQLVTLAQQANAGSATDAERQELNASFQQIKDSITNYVAQIRDSGSVAILTGAAGIGVQYSQQSDGTAITFAAPGIDAQLAAAHATVGPDHPAIAAAADFEIEEAGAAGPPGEGRAGSLIAVNIMLGRYTGMIAQVKAIEGFFQSHAESLLSVAGDLQDKIDAELNPDITGASQQLSLVGALKQLVNATSIVIGKDAGNQAAALSQVIAAGA